MSQKPDFDPSVHFLGKEGCETNEINPSSPGQNKEKKPIKAHAKTSQYGDDWISQEDALFGTNHRTNMENPQDNRKLSGSTIRREEEDLELARQLQTQMDLELEMQRKEEEESIALARQMERENHGSTNINHDQHNTESVNSQEDRDEALARAIMQEETSNSMKDNSVDSHCDDDLELALQMQQFENMGMGKLNSFKNPNEQHGNENNPIMQQALGNQASNIQSDIQPDIQNTLETTNSADHNNNKKKKKGIIGTLRKLGLISDEELSATVGVGDSHDPSPISSPGPIPHSFSVKRMLPVSPQPQMDINPSRKNNPGRKKHKEVPVCSVCGKLAYSYLQTLGKKYHAECFRCMGCHDIIDPSSSFAFTRSEDGEKHPLHRKCYAELFGIKRAVCKESIPPGPDGKISYVKHPFFETEQMCPKHAVNPGRRCTGCHRFEPIGNNFIELDDGDRCVCFSCCRTVIVDSGDAKPLWEQIISFFENTLELPIWKDMLEIPVLVVGHDALNNNLGNSIHSGSSQIMTRGLCLSEHQSGRRIALRSMKFDEQNRSFTPANAQKDGFTYFRVPDASKVNPTSSVTAILCLSGLPRDLSASVLAHEATHAWLKLHPAYDIRRPIPPMVEEGCCQLVAHLFLDQLEPASSQVSEDGGPSDEKLRQYFKFSIETDENEIYGEGYRQAARLYAEIGILALLSHVVHYKDFPII